MSAVNAKTALAYTRLWHHVDANGRIVGRLAVKIAQILMGKHKPIFTRFNDCGDYVVVTNTRGLHFTGNKLYQKGYYTHSGYPGGLKRIPAWVMMQQRPETVLFRAVKGMLPKNRSRKHRLARLRIFPDNKNPYAVNISKSYEMFPQKIWSLSGIPGGALRW